ncbi:acyl-CoA thioesterase [Kordiimonas sp.]|uniref:acyl-CoA thioesterase n=1 Tax=Kordiimonas sp. TaxID=1970157 RepID=UPI003A90D90A
MTYPLYRTIAHPQQCDVMGHLNIREYMAMFDEASYQLLFDIFGWTGEDALLKGVGFADVKHEIEYKAEVSAGQPVVITGKLTRIGGKSLALSYEMTNQASGELAATLACVCVLFDTKERKAMAIEGEYRAMAEAFLAGEQA